MSFANLRKNKGAGNLANKFKESTAKGQRGPSEFYYPAIDKEKGTASATLRFLPTPDRDGVEMAPIVTVYSHGFKGDDGRWCIIDTCPTTVAGAYQCPICTRNSELWNTGREDLKKVASERKRKKQFISNVLVIKDPKNPENEGKVFPFKYGPTLYEKIQGAITPKFEDATPIDPFDMWTGADFKLRIARDPAKNNQITYENSSFDAPSELFPQNDKAKEAVYNQCIDIYKYVQADKLDTEAAVEKKAAQAYAKILGGVGSLVNESGSASPELPREQAPRQNAPSFPSESAGMDQMPTGDDSGDTDLDYFKKLAQED